MRSTRLAVSAAHFVCNPLSCSRLRWLHQGKPSPFKAAVLVGLVGLAPACAPEPHRMRFPQRRVQLFARLDQFSVESGFINDSPRFLRLVQDPDRNEDQGALRLRVAPSCVVASPELEIFANSQLELGIGLGWGDALVPDEGSKMVFPPPGAVDYASRFRVRWRSAAGSAERLLGQREVVLALPKSRIRESWTLDLAELAGERGRFLLEVERSAGPPDLRVLPAWWSPTLSSPAVSNPPRSPRALERERVVVDLLAESPAARVFREDVLIGRVGEDLPTVAMGTFDDAPNPTVRLPLASIQAHFETAAGLVHKRGGAKPALAVAESCRLVWPSVDVESKQPVELCFELGIEERMRALSGVELEVQLRVNGREAEPIVLTSSAGDFSEGWSETLRMPIKLSGTSALELELSIRVATDGGSTSALWLAPDTSERQAVQAVSLQKPWIGIARPRLVAKHELVPQSFGAEARPSVLILCAETLRADELGPWGGTHTPALDSWAQEGLRFERAYSPASWTLPSVTSMLTGLDPGVHGAVSGESDQLADWCESLAEAASWQGIRTGAFISNSLIRRSVGFAAGFDTFVEASSANAHQLNRSLLDWLSEQPEQRFFAYVHFFDPHTPYNAPGEFREVALEKDLRGLPYDEQVKRVRREKLGRTRLTPETEPLRFLRGRYRGELQYFDAQIGLLLDELNESGVLSNTLVAFVSDHGEEFGEHAWYGHGNNLYQESTHVPLMLWGAGVERGVIEEPVGTLELSVLTASTLNLNQLAGKLQRRRPLLPLQPRRLAPVPIWMASDKAVDFSGDWSSMLEQTERLEPRPIRALLFAGKKAIFQFSSFPKSATLDSISSVLTNFELYDAETDESDHRVLSHAFEDLPEAMKAPLLSRIEAELKAPKHMLDASITAQMIDILGDLGYIDTDSETELEADE